MHFSILNLGLNLFGRITGLTNVFFIVELEKTIMSKLGLSYVMMILSASLSVPRDILRKNADFCVFCYFAENGMIAKGQLVDSVGLRAAGRAS
jgi:hypothetical protein